VHRVPELLRRLPGLIVATGRPARGTVSIVDVLSVGPLWTLDPLGQGGAPGDVEDDPADPAGALRGQEQGRVGHVIRRAQAADGVGVDELLPALAGDPGLVGLGQDGLRGQAVGPDPERPDLLVYNAGENPHGQLKLVALEYEVFTADWLAAGHTNPPTMLGHEMKRLVLPQFDFDAYELHLWIWHDNPAGLFEDFNPSVPMCH